MPVPGKAPPMVIRSAMSRSYRRVPEKFQGWRVAAVDWSTNCVPD